MFFDVLAVLGSLIRTIPLAGDTRTAAGSAFDTVAYGLHPDSEGVPATVSDPVFSASASGIPSESLPKTPGALSLLVAVLDGVVERVEPEPSGWWYFVSGASTVTVTVWVYVLTDGGGGAVDGEVTSTSAAESRA